MKPLLDDHGKLSWHAVAQRCVQMLVATTCVVAVLLATASSPDADEFTRGIPAALLGALGQWLSGQMFGGGK